MRLQSPIGTLNGSQLRVLALSLVLAVVMAASGLVYPSPYAPLLGAMVVAVGGALVSGFWRPAWILYAALFVVFLPAGLMPADLHSTLNRASAVAAFIVWFPAVLARRRQVWLTAPAWLMLAFIAWSIVTLAWSNDRSIAWIGIQAYVLRFIVYLLLMANLVRTRRDLGGLMAALALIGWTLLLISVSMLLRDGYVPGSRLQVLQANENLLGVVLLTALPGVLWKGTISSGARKTLWSGFGLIYMALSLLVIGFSGSRGSAVSFVLTLVTFWFWKSTRLWSKLGLVILVVALLSLPFAFSTLAARFAVESGDTLLGGREALWMAAWQLIQDHPWLGVGIRNAQYEIRPYLTVLRSIAEFDITPIHNPVLTVWADGGLPGLLLYLAVLASSAWLFIREYLSARRSDREWLMPYFALVASVFLGYMATWIKGGGLESDFSYFLFLALLVLPSCLRKGQA